VDNDATVAALAEAHDGERLVYRDLVMFTVGTGIGGGLVLGGRVFRGATGAAGELGHTLIGLDLKGGVPEPGAFPQPGSLESLASGRALDRLAGVAAAASPDSQLGRLAASGHPVLGPEVVEAAQAGDEESHRLLDVVVVGGGAARAGELLLGPARETARRFVLPGVGDQTEIRLARYGPEAGVRGAALLASQEIEREGM
jgi:glucokinase